jgi:hypothetical protein
MASNIVNNTSEPIYVALGPNGVIKYYITVYKFGPKKQAIVTTSEPWDGKGKPSSSPDFKFETLASSFQPWYHGPVAKDSFIAAGLVNTALYELNLTELDVIEKIPVPPPPPDPDPTDYKLKGSVVDASTLEPLSDFKVEDEDGSVGEEFEYDGEYNFEINGTYTPSSGSFPGRPLKLTFSKSQYETKSGVIAIKKDQTINNSIFPIKLIGHKPATQAGLNQINTSTPEEKELMASYSKEDAIQLLTSKMIGIIEDRLLPFLIKKLLGEPFGIYDPIGLVKTAKSNVEKLKGAVQDAKDAHEEKQEYKREKTELEKDVEAQQEIKEKEWAGRENEIKTLEKEKDNLPDDMDEEEREKEEKKIDKKIEKIRKSLKKDKDKFAKWLKDQND